jgi:hypothetical protein
MRTFTSELMPLLGEYVCFLLSLSFSLPIHHGMTQQEGPCQMLVLIFDFSVSRNMSHKFVSNLNDSFRYFVSVAQMD